MGGHAALPLWFGLLMVFSFQKSMPWNGGWQAKQTFVSWLICNVICRLLCFCCWFFFPPWWGEFLILSCPLPLTHPRAISNKRLSWIVSQALLSILGHMKCWREDECHWYSSRCSVPGCCHDDTETASPWSTHPSAVLCRVTKEWVLGLGWGGVPQSVNRVLCKSTDLS